jgi:hypothetical protein
MDIDFCGFAHVHPWGDNATRLPAPCSTRHAALQILAIPPGIAAVCPCRARPSQRLGPFALSKGALSAFGAAALTLAWHADHGTGKRVQLPFLG